MLVRISVVLLLLLPATAHARVNVVTLPGRDSVQLTIYNSADLTMVRETRFLTLRKGINKLQFSWANTLIDPTSVEFRALTHADEVEVLDVSFPARVTNTLEWRIQSEAATEVKVEIRYFTSGISWSADYLAEADRLEKVMTLAGHVRVNNHSGEDYENAEVRLVVGVIRLVEEIAELARRGRPASDRSDRRTRSGEDLNGRLKDDVGLVSLAMAEAEAAPRAIVKEGVSEYFLYTVEGRDTIPNGWSKRLPSFRVADVSIASYYKFEPEQWGDGVHRFYRFKNDKQSHLGTEPLPNGLVNVFRLVTADNLYGYVGATNVKYIPIGEAVELMLGTDLEVMVKPILMNWEKNDIRFNNDGQIIGWTHKETWKIEVQNSKEIDVTVDIRRTFPGDRDLKTDAAFENVDAQKVKFVMPLKPGEKREFTYFVTTRLGTNVTR